MKILFYCDNHLSTYSSIVRGRGERFSHRLLNQINTVNWIEELADKYNCEEIICGGDFFDSSTINAEELSAVQEIKWNKKVRHRFICGNHEMYSNDHLLSALSILGCISDNYGNFDIIKQVKTIECGNTIIVLLPYILEANRDNFCSYLPKVDSHKVVVLMHNDLMGLQLGNFISQTGFDIDEITKNVDLCINGHYHNHYIVNDKIINLGNTTGQNFSEQSSVYSHYCLILDTDTLKYEFIENPFAFNFYKLDNELNINKIKNNAVISIKLNEDNANFDLIKKTLEEYKTLGKIVEYKTTVIPKKQTKEEIVSKEEALNNINHLDMFDKYILETLPQTKELLEELTEIRK